MPTRAIAALLAAMALAGCDGSSGPSLRWEPWPASPSDVGTLIEHKGDLHAGGDYMSIYGNATSGLARWDGEQWIGMPWHEDGVNVYHLTAFEADLIACGVSWGDTDPVFRERRWDGEQWQRLRPGLRGPVTCSRIYRGRLILGGTFGEFVPLDYVAGWDGEELFPLGEGMNGPVADLAVHGDRLVAAGGFTAAGGAAAAGLAMWDGVAWSPFPSLPPLLDPSLPAVRALIVYGGLLVVSGDFDAGGDGQIDPFLWAWNGESWRIFGPDPMSRCFLFDGRLMSFRIEPGKPAYLVSWLGRSWIPVGPALAAAPKSVAIASGELVVAGPRGFLPSDPKATIAVLREGIAGAFAP